MLTQFRDPDGRPTLGDYIPVKRVYPAGRLDRDSEGLLILTDDGRLQAKISHPRHKMEKGYWVQVEGIPDEFGQPGGRLLDISDYRKAGIAENSSGLQGRSIENGGFSQEAEAAVRSRRAAG